MTKLEKDIDHATVQVDEVIRVLVKRLVEIREGMPGSDKLPDNIAKMSDVLKRISTVTLATKDIEQVFAHLYELRRTLTLMDLTAP